MEPVWLGGMRKKDMAKDKISEVGKARSSQGLHDIVISLYFVLRLVGNHGGVWIMGVI